MPDIALILCVVAFVAGSVTCRPPSGRSSADVAATPSNPGPPTEGLSESSGGSSRALTISLSLTRRALSLQHWSRSFALEEQARLNGLRLSNKCAADTHEVVLSTRLYLPTPQFCGPGGLSSRRQSFENSFFVFRKFPSTRKADCGRHAYTFLRDWYEWRTVAEFCARLAELPMHLEQRRHVTKCSPIAWLCRKCLFQTGRGVLLLACGTWTQQIIMEYVNRALQCIQCYWRQGRWTAGIYSTASAESHDLMSFKKSDNLVSSFKSSAIWVPYIFFGPYDPCKALQLNVLGCTTSSVRSLLHKLSWTQPVWVDCSATGPSAGLLHMVLLLCHILVCVSRALSWYGGARANSKLVSYSISVLHCSPIWCCIFQCLRYWHGFDLQQNRIFCHR